MRDRSTDRQQRHLDRRSGQRQGHADHQRQRPAERADLVAGWQAGRLRLHSREHFEHLPEGRRRHWRSRAGVQLHTGRRNGPHRLVVGQQVHDLLHRRDRPGAARWQPPASERKEIDWLREDYDAGQGRFSPDNRYIAFISNEADVDRGEVYVRPFDPSKPDAPLTGPAIRVSKDGAIGMIAWRQDGKELYFMTRNWEVMAVDVETSPVLQSGDAADALQPARTTPWKRAAVEERQSRRTALPVRDAHERERQSTTVRSRRDSTSGAIRRSLMAPGHLPVGDVIESKALTRSPSDRAFAICIANISAGSVWHPHCEVRRRRARLHLAPITRRGVSFRLGSSFLVGAFLQAMVDSSQVCSAIWVGRARRCAGGQA